MDGKLLAVRNVGRGIAVVERDDEIAVRKHYRIRALREVARMLVVGVRERIAEEAVLRRRAADVLRLRPGLRVIRGHRPEDRALAILARVGIEIKDGPGHIDVVLVRARSERVGDDELLVVTDQRTVRREALVVLNSDVVRTGAAERVVERPFRPGRRLHHVDPTRVRVDVEDDAAEERPAIGVECHHRVATCVVRMSRAWAARDRVAVGGAVQMPAERRQHVTPVPAVVE